MSDGDNAERAELDAATALLERLPGSSLEMMVERAGTALLRRSEEWDGDEYQVDVIARIVLESARIPALIDSRAPLMERAIQAESDAADLADRLSRALEHNKALALIEALAKYGKHNPPCHYAWLDPPKEPTCTCGLAEALVGEITSTHTTDTPITETRMREIFEDMANRPVGGP